jgi:hypothetical protein
VRTQCLKAATMNTDMNAQDRTLRNVTIP